MEKFLALVPARAGSKRLPKKNTRKFAGHPLIAWTIKTALKSSYISSVYVSTEDKDIARISKKYGALVPFFRSVSLANDTASSVDVAVEFIKNLQNEGKYFENLVFLQPTSPLRLVNDIDKAIELFENSLAKSLVSVKKLDTPIGWAGSVKGNTDNKNLLFKKNNDLLHYKYNNLFIPNGAIYVVSIKNLMRTKKFISNSNTQAYIMPRDRSIDIDEEFDFRVAEFFVKYKKYKLL